MVNEDTVFYHRLVTGGFSSVEADIICSALSQEFERGNYLNNTYFRATARRILEELQTESDHKKL